MVDAGLCGSRCQVAAQAILIVGSGIAHEFLVRVVTGHAGEAWVAFLSPAPALFQAIRLRANIRDPRRRSKPDVPPRTVTSSAEIDGIKGAELSRIEDQIPLLSAVPHLSL